MIRQSLNRVTWWLERHIVPGNRYAQLVYEEQLAPLVGRADARWLDVGCGRAVLPEWRERAERDLVERCGLAVGMDPDGSAIARHRSIRFRAVGVAERLPFADGSFDVASANMVVEHLAAPATQLGEIARVVRPGGRVILHTPNAVSYAVLISRILPEGLKLALARLLEGRASADVYPTYYRANSPREIRRLAAALGLELERLVMTNTSPAFLAFPPLALLELLWLRFLSAPARADLRSNIIAILRKP